MQDTMWQHRMECAKIPHIESSRPYYGIEEQGWTQATDKWGSWHIVSISAKNEDYVYVVWRRLLVEKDGP